MTFLGVKIVFLDFDGVLNSRAHFGGVDETTPPTPKELEAVESLQRHYGGRYPKQMLVHDLRSIDPKAVELLSQIIEKSGASVVISSSWRHGNTIPCLQAILGHHGFKGPIIGATPDTVPTPKGFSCPLRGHEIQAWLDLHPEVERFCILDDDTDMAHLRQHLVRTDFACGLTEGNVKEALVILGAPGV